MISADENETFAFAIIVDDKVVGSIGVFRQENIHRQTAELGHYVADKYWGKGIMTEAVTQISLERKEKRASVSPLVPPFSWICFTSWSAIWSISCFVEMMWNTLMMNAIRITATRM